MRLRLLVFLFALQAGPAAAQPSAWYDAADLMASLRAAERRTVVAQAQLGAASELPLYELTLTMAGDLRSFDLDETAWITNRAGRPLSELVFRIFANATGEAGQAPLVDFLEAECLDGVSCATQAVSPSAIVVRPDRPLAANARLRVRMRLRGRLRDIPPERATMMGQSLESLGALTGAHGTGDYGLLAHSEGVASMSYFFPVLARMRDGRFEQGDASTLGDPGTDELGHVRASVRVPDGARVAASGVLAAPRVVGGRTEHVISAGFVRDFAIVASPRFRSSERRTGEVVVRSWYLDGDDASGAFVLDVASHALAIFTRRFGPYPYTELDVVQAPLVGGAGGMELSGLVTIATMFYRPIRLDAGAGLLGQLLGGAQGAPDLEELRRAMLEHVTAHEVAHQWWHGLVGSDSRQHPFQDESLAQYSAMLYFAERHGADRARRESDRQIAAGYHMMRLSGRPDAPVDQPVSAFADSMSYAGIVYGKGPFLYPALRSLVGDGPFFTAIRAHVREHRFRIAPPRALYERMARGAHADRVRALVRHWLEETHGDADLGQPSLGRVLGTGTGGDPATRMIEQILGQLGGGGPATAPSDADVRELMRGLMQMMQQGGP